MNKWFVYILECSDKSFYTGIAVDIEKRIREHNHDNKLGSKYIRARRPVKIVYKEEHRDRASASKREAEIKKMGRNEKISLINSQSKKL